MTAVAEDADTQRVPLGHDALAVQGGEQRDLDPLDEAPHLIAGPAADSTETGERDDGLAVYYRVCQDGRDLLDTSRVRQDRRHVEPDVAVVFDLDTVLGEVLRHVDVDRAGASLERDVDRILEHVARVGDVG